MSWAGGTFDFKDGTSERAMMVEIEDCLNHERGYLEPVHQKLKLINSVEPLGTREEAEEWISEHYKDYGRRYNYGVRYISYDNVKPTKKQQELERRIAEIEKKRIEYASAHSVKNFKSEYVGCPGCGSKLKAKLVTADRCPLCKQDLRSNTTITTLQGYTDKIKDLKKQLAAEQKKFKSKGDVYWLINAEVYIG